MDTFDLTSIGGILQALAWLASSAGSAAVAAMLYAWLVPSIPVDALRAWLTDERVQTPLVRLLGTAVATAAGYLIIPAQYVADLPISAQIDAALALIVPPLLGVAAAWITQARGVRAGA